MALYLVRQLTSSELLQRLKTIGVKHPELCKALGELCGPPLLPAGGPSPWFLQVAMVPWLCHCRPCTGHEG